MRLPRPKSIFARILLTAMLPIVLLAALLSTYAINARLDDLRSAFVERGDATANQLASVAVIGLFTGDKTMLRAASERIVRSSKLVKHVVIHNRENEVMAEAGRDEPLINETAPASFSAPVVPPILEADDAFEARILPEPLGQVTVQFDTRSVLAAEARVLRNALIITLAAVALAVLLTIVAARQIVRPIEHLRDIVGRIQDGDLSARVSNDSDGEVGELQKGFNSMAERIDLSAKDLQRQVDQATNELRAALNDLETRNTDLDLARRREREANRAKSTFLANMSHEIRTPMNGVLGFADLLQKTELNETQREFLDTISQSANNLLTIINDILDFSQMETGTIRLEQVAFSLPDAIEDVTSLLTPQAHDKGLDLIVCIDEPVPPRLVGDVTRLRHILTNLVGNAIKFTDNGEVILQVQGNTDDTDLIKLELSVCDTGIGIPQGAMENLFQPFSQGPASTRRLYGGTGLGLSICQSLTEAMGGRIQVRSTVGKGTCFTVSLPLAIGAEPPVTETEVTAESRKAAIVVDSHPVSRRALDQTVRSAGLEVHSFDRPPTNPDIFHPAMLLLRLPATSTRQQVAASIAEIQQTTASPLCLLLSNSDPQLREFAQQHGACCVQTYPARNRKLIAAIRHCLGQEAGHRELAVDDLSPRLAVWLAGRVVLIADDNPMNLRLLDTLLRSYGATVLQARDGAEALHMAQCHPVDMLLVDVHMPGVNGIEVARTIRTRRPDAQPPVIALTADAGMEGQLGAGAGFDACLIKPLREDKLREALSDLLQSVPDHSRTSDANIIPEKSGPTAELRNRKQAVVIAGGNEKVADELYGELLQRLPDSLASIHAHYGAQDWDAMWQSVHKLHGSASVCAVPALEGVLQSLEAALTTRDDHDTAMSLSRLQREADRLVADHARPGSGSRPGS